MRISNAELTYYKQVSLEEGLIGTLNKEMIVYDFFKRCSDIIFALVALPIGGTIILITSLIIKLESKGHVFFSQERVGVRGKEFKMYKLRSMRNDAEKHGVMWAGKEDPRVTKVGKFIRKTRVDELPQLINILKGDMSLVGPRPEREVFYHKFENEVPGFCNRLQVKPGLTGYAQVNGGYDITPAEKLKWDMKYIENRSFIVDMKIIIMTVLVVFTGDGAR